MGLPYIQVDTDFIHSKAPKVAAILRIHRHVAIGMALELFERGVSETSTKDKPPDGCVIDPDAALIISAWAGWEGDPDSLIGALLRSEVVEKLEIGYRIKGMERYRATWEKNNRRKPGGNRTVTGEKPAGLVPVTGEKPEKTGPEMESKRKTEKELLPSEVVGKQPTAPKTPGLVLIEAPTKPREQWGFSDFEQWAQFTRQSAGLAPQRSIPILEADPTWQAMTKWTEGEIQPVCDAFIAFGKDEFWQLKKPPLPLRGFLSQWNDYMPMKGGKRAHG